MKIIEKLSSHLKKSKEAAFIVKFCVCLIFILALMALCGCRATQAVRVEYKKVTKIDTIYSVRNDTIREPADTSLLALFVRCDSLNNVLFEEVNNLKGTRSHIIWDTQGDNGYIYIYAICDSLNEIIQSQDLTIKQYEKELETRTIQEPDRKARVRMFTAGFMVGVVVCFIALIIFKIKK